MMFEFLSGFGCGHGARFARMLLVLVFLVTALSKATFAADTLAQAVRDGTPIIDLRYRYEIVDQDNFGRNAYASTLRSRIGYQSDTFNGFMALIEFENVTNIGDDRYNSTTNRKSFLPLVADPEATEINRAHLSYTTSKTTFTAGRQRISLDDGRFVGHVGFRQNEQTFDALHLVSRELEGLTASYSYIFKTHRIFGDDSPVGNYKGDVHLVNTLYDQLPIGTIAAYAYFIDLDQAPALSNKTMGTMLTGKKSVSEGLSFTYKAAYAHQTDYQANPFDLSLGYYVLEAGLSTDKINIRGGYEVLEGDGLRGFATPLATLHKFQGFADVFLTTPVNGVEDAYLTADITLNTGYEIFRSVTLAAWYHDYESENGSISLGNEVDLLVSTDVSEWLSLEIKYADYSGLNVTDNREKLWITAALRF